MGRFSRFNGNIKPFAVGVAQTVIFPAAEIESTGVVDFQVAWSGANPAASIINRIRVRASGATLIDLPYTAFQAWQQRFFKSNTADVSADQILNIPFFLPDAPTMDEADRCQFPLGAQAQVELDLLAAVAAGSAIIGWTQTDIAPQYFPRCYSQPMNIPASVRNGKYSFSESGIIRGLIMPMVGIERCIATISGRNAYDLPGRSYSGLTFPRSILEDKDAAYATEVVTTPRALSVDLGIPAAFGSSFITLDTAGGWGGVTNELAIYAVDSQNVQAANPAASGGQNTRG